MEKTKKENANKNRSANVKGITKRSEFVLTDPNPRECPYNNPPGQRYVRGYVISPDGKKGEKGLFCLPSDQIQRIMASEKKKK